MKSKKELNEEHSLYRWGYKQCKEDVLKLIDDDLIINDEFWKWCSKWKHVPTSDLEKFVCFIKLKLRSEIEGTSQKDDKTNKKEVKNNGNKNT